MKIRLLNLTCILMVICHCPLLYAQDFESKTCLDLIQDKLLGRFETAYSEISAGGITKAEFYYEHNGECLKIATHDRDDFRLIAALIPILPGLNDDVQMYNDGGYYDPVADVFVGQQRAFCFKQLETFFQSAETARDLEGIPVFYFLNFFGLVTENDAFSEAAEEAPNVFGENDGPLVTLNSEADRTAAEIILGVEDCRELVPVTLTTVGGATTTLFAPPRNRPMSTNGMQFRMKSSR